MDASRSFGSRNFADVQLGDVRRTRRLVRLVDGMARHPGGTLPDKFPVPADLRAFYRLMNCDRVHHEVLIQAHAEATRQALADAPPGVVLVLHDATELDFTSKTSLDGQLGQIGQGTHRGYICHNSLAVRLVPNEARDAMIPETVGLLSQILHHRPRVAKDETAKQSRERSNRESRLWVRGVQACGPVPPGVACIDVSDSLSDTFEYMAYEATHDRQFVLRVREDRRLDEPVGGHLLETVRALPASGRRTVAIRSSPGRSARISEVQVAFTPVRIAPPGKKLGEYAAVALDLWAVRVWEAQTPAGEEPLEWILLTNRPVAGLADAQERIDWYEWRWIVENDQADCTSSRRWVGTRRIGYHRRDGAARTGRVVPATPKGTHRRSRMSDPTRRRPTPPRA
jgi:hypothetical protein